MALPRKLTAKIYEIKAHNDSVSSLDLGETGRVLVTGGHDCNVNLWAIGEETCFMSLTGHNRPIECVRFAYNDDFVYSADDIGIIRRWDLNAQTICSTLNGHMKGVRTLDFNPSGEYVVSGSNDTTVRLWDVRNQNKCIKAYRGHIAAVNSVKFSPDGLWIASAGTEGSVIIWDIRKSKQIMDFTELPPAPAITCIQYHPFEFLLAVGRLDGTVGIYDLESRMAISKTDSRSYFYGNPIKCITFSENGECLFVGTEAGVSVIGWEPDREFDHIKSAWTRLGDMKIVNRRLIIGSYEQEYVTVNALSIDRVFPFYNPSNTPAPAFMHNATTRKSFSRGNQKLRLSLVPKSSQKPSRLVEENEDNRSPSLDGQSSPNLSLELVDEPAIDINSSTTSVPLLSSSTVLNGVGVGIDTTTSFVGGPNNDAPHFDTIYNESKISSPPYNFGSSMTPAFGYSSLMGHEMTGLGCDGPSSLKMPGERDIYQFERLVSTFNNDFEYNMNDSNPPIITNYDHTEMVEDFPVNQATSTSGTAVGVSSSNNTSGVHQNYAQKTMKSSKTSSNIQKRSTQIAVSSLSASVRNGTTTSSNLQGRNRLSHQIASMSTTELHKMDDSVLLKKSASSNIVNKGGGGRRISETQSQFNNKENSRSRNITVQIITKPPTRSRTSLELRSPSSHHQQSLTSSQRHSHRIGSYSETSSTTATTTPTNIPVSYRVDPSLITSSGINQKGFNNRSNIDDSSEIQMLSSYHEQVYQELSNRHATLQLIRNSTRSHDIVGALKQAIKMNGRTVFVDLLGAILEKTSSWNLDLCLILLPEIYELLQSQHKFHYTRACDTLRVILSNFLPIIQENLDPWAANGLGVDVTREERQRKCIECQRWLLQIRSIPERNHLGTTLTQLQNMIVNI